MRVHSNLPDTITLPSGEVLKPVIGGHLEQKPFLTVVNVTKSGWGMNWTHNRENWEIIAEAKRRKLKYRRVKVLSRNLRGKLDLHHRPYTPSVWVFVQAANNDKA